MMLPSLAGLFYSIYCFTAAGASEVACPAEGCADQSISMLQARSERSRTRDADSIICPILATAVSLGQIVPDAQGEVPFGVLAQFLTDIGVGSLALAERNNPSLNVTLKIFEMDGDRNLEHGKSSGIRDPTKNRTALDFLLQHANHNGVFTVNDLWRAGAHFDAYPHRETHDPNPTKPTTAMVLAAFLLPIFGRCGPENRLLIGGFLGSTVSHYPPDPDCGEELFMRQDDLENIFWNNRYPDDFQFKV